jgi:ParB-like chromosome segregation protein Spo0J
MLKQRYEIHPAATLFPLMTEEEYEGLKQDIAENGQREDIVVWCGKLIDGRNRLRACEELQRQPSIAELDEDQDPWKYVISHNLHRRHLTTTQKANVAANVATLKRGEIGNGRKVDVSKDSSTVEEAAKLLNVSVASVHRAKTVQEHGSKELIAAMERGDISVTFAAKFATEEPDKKTQTKLLNQGKEAMKAHITEPSPFIDADDEPVKPTKPSDEEKCVAAFCKCKSRLVALKAIIDKLEPHERIAVADWLK